MSINVTLNDKLLFPSEYLAAADLQGRDVNLTIDHVELADLQTQGGKKTRKPIIYFQRTPKKMVLNKTVAKTIKGIYGGKVEGWRGKKITVFPTTCEAFGNIVECIRVRDVAPGVPVAPPVEYDEPAGEVNHEDQP